jgi:two-component system response regulator AgrA
MLDIYVCEDNAGQRMAVTAFISDYCTIGGLDASVVLSTPSPCEILKAWNGENPSLFFLDIDLKTDMNGIDLACHIRGREASGQKVFIVFLTSHTEMSHMTFQYKVEALDFIPKDNSENMKKRIGECLQTALMRHITGGNGKILRITVGDKIHRLSMDEVIYIETTHVRHKLRVHAKNRVLECNGELNDIQKQLDERFVRCHKSYIINKDKIDAVSKKQSTVTMCNNGVCPLSRSGKKLI